MVKVVCLGGSVAGLNTALYLLSSSSKFDVTILERKKAIGDNIVCGGAIASYMIKKLKLEIPREFIASKVKSVRFYSPTLDYAELKLKKEYGIILWRARWERWLGERIKELGGKFYFRNKFPSVFADADVIVGADGLLGVTREMADLPFPSKENVHVAVQGLFKLKGQSEDEIAMFFSNQFSPCGYSWIFPQGNSEFRVGLGVPLTYSRSVSKFFLKFITELESLGMKPKKITSIKGKLIPTAKPPKTNVIGNIAFVGDAGLMCGPATGGGIAPAIMGAKCLAEALDRGNLKLYDKLWKRELYGRNRQRYKLKQILCEMSDGEFQMLIDVLKDFKPVSESLGVALIHLLLELAFRHPKVFTKHKVLRRLFIR